MRLPLAFFWDIENCQIPATKSAFDVVQRLRGQFGHSFAEVEFIVVCDVTKERPDVVEDLNAAQITVIHVKSLAKNACDDKLRTSMTKFGMCYRPPGVVVLISSDVNFAHSLTDLRYRCGFCVVLLHNERVSNTLVMTATQHYEWQTDILAFVPDRQTPLVPTTTARPYKIFVSNLPNGAEHKIRDRLHHLCDNCGGRVVEFNNVAKTAKIAFVTLESAMRAQKRMHGTNVFGKSIAVCLAQDGVKQPNWSCVAPSTPASQFHHASTSPASLTYIGRSAIAHHFTSAEPFHDVAERIIAATKEEESRVSAVAAAVEAGEQVQGGSSEGDIVEIPPPATSMNAMQNYCEETERLKRTLNVGGNHDRVVWTGGAEIDEGLDFTPVKMTENVRSNEAGQYNRRSRNNSTSVPMPSPGERQLHSPSSKLRLLERFAREAVELLRISPQCQILLARFASTWCSHFNRPLRLAEFGYAKLTDLLAEASDTLQVVERSQEKWVTLTPTLLKNSLRDQIVSILRQQPQQRAPVNRLLEFYQSTFGYALNLRLFGFNSMEEVLTSMHELVEIETTCGAPVVTLVEFRHRQMLTNQLLYMFIRCPERRLASWQLENEFRSEFGVDVSLDDVKKFLSDLVQITEYDADTIFVELNEMQRLALRLRRILVLNNGELPLHELEQIYGKQYGERILLSDDTGGHKSVVGVLRSASHVLYLKGRGGNSAVCINRNFLSSLKDLKPDLFIPSEAPKMKKRCHGHPRSISAMSMVTSEKITKSYGGRQANMAVLEKQGRLHSGHEIKPASPTESPQPRMGLTPSPTLTIDSISATSTPPETNGFEKEKKRAHFPTASTANVLIAGSGVLPKNQISFPSSVFAVRSPMSKSMVKTRLELKAFSQSSSPVVPLSSRRCRLAANFGALPKCE